MEDEERTIELLTTLKLNLSDAELEVFNLLMNQYDYKKIAEILNKNPKQIDNTIQRIRNKLKKML